MPRFDVTVVGELNLDLILYGLPEELPRERELLASGMMVTLGSSSAILAHNLAVLGGRVGFVSLIGDDPLGKIALERLAAGGVDISKTKTARGGTTGLTVVLPRPTWRNNLTYQGTMADMRFEDLDLQYLADSRHFHLSSLFLQRALRPRIAELFRRMKEAGLTTSLDTNDDSEDRYDGVAEILKYVDVFLPNEREAKRIARTEKAKAALDRLAEMVPLLVVKMGPEGARARKGQEEFRHPGVRVKAVDPVGAGDSFNAGFLYQYVRGAEVGKCLEYGNLAGAFSTTQPGGTEAFRAVNKVREFFGKAEAGRSNG